MFKTGELLFTSHLYSIMEENFLFDLFIFESIIRHTKGDWGDCCESDKTSNDLSLVNGGRLFSSYTIPEGVVDKPKIWIITEWDRSVTTVLFPEEY